MNNNELKEVAKRMRECADILDEIGECEGEDRVEELAGRFIVKFTKMTTALNK